jgi:hypothetical protein
MPHGRFLFSDRRLFDFLTERLQQARASVQEVEQTRLLSSPVNDMVEHLIADHMLTVPELRTESLSALPPHEVTIEAEDFGRRLRIPGVSVTVRVPFIGEPKLLQYQPSTYTTAPPEGAVWQQELRLTYEWEAQRPIDLNAAIQKHIQSIQQYLEWVRVDVEAFNQKVRALLVEEVSQRQQRLEQATRTVTGLGLLIRPDEETESRTVHTQRTTAHTSPSPEFDVFISHASEDKTAFVAPLAHYLVQQGLRVWYDAFTLKLGDRLRQSIDRGLARSRYGIVVLSQAFFEKHWPQYELDGLAALEVSGRKVILPIWHGVSREDVARVSPPLADRVAVNSTLPLETVAAKILEVVRE